MNSTSLSITEGQSEAIQFNTPATATKAAVRFFSLIAVIVLMLTAGSQVCSAKNEPTMTNGQVLSATQLSKSIGAICGDDAYAVVETQWLKWYYNKFRSELAQGAYGIVKWQENFDCNRFAAKYAADAQVRFFSHSFHSSSSARALAVGEFWYQPTNAPHPHAIVFAYTEKGLVFLDPQTGNFVSLSPREIGSHMLAKI